MKYKLDRIIKKKLIDFSVKHNKQNVKMINKITIPIDNFNELYPPQNKLISIYKYNNPNINIVNCKDNSIKNEHINMSEMSDILDKIYSNLINVNENPNFIKTINKYYPNNIITNTFVNDSNKKYLFNGYQLIYSKYISTLVNSCNVNNIKYLLKYNIEVDSINVLINIFSKKSFKFNDNIAIESAKRIISISKFSSENKKTPNIIIFRYKNKKITNLNLNNPIFTPDNINSAVTDTIDNIIIYRDEELLKSILHESIHYYNIDFNNNNYPNEFIQKIINNKEFKLNININPSDILISEGYTEWLANLLNISILSKTQNELDKKYNDEIKHSILKAKRIYSIINDSKDKILKETTNTFAYYIIKLIFLINTNNIMVKLNAVNNIKRINFDQTYKNFKFINELINEFNMSNISNIGNKKIMKKSKKKKKNNNNNNNNSKKSRKYSLKMTRYG